MSELAGLLADWARVEPHRCRPMGEGEDRKGWMGWYSLHWSNGKSYAFNVYGKRYYLGVQSCRAVLAEAIRDKGLTIDMHLSIKELLQNYLNHFDAFSP